MNDSLIPRRYAKALLKYCDEKGTQQRVYGLMNALIESFAANPSLSEVIANPFVADDEKRSLIMTAAGADASTDEALERFITLLITNNRIGGLKEMALAYRDLYRRQEKIYPVKVTSAAPLSPDEERRLKEIIRGQLDGGSMEYTSAVDPDLLGGFVVDIDSRQLDASIKNELKQLRLKLLSK